MGTPEDGQESPEAYEIGHVNDLLMHQTAGLRTDRSDIARAYVGIDQKTAKVAELLHEAPAEAWIELTFVVKPGKFNAEYYARLTQTMETLLYRIKTFAGESRCEQISEPGGLSSYRVRRSALKKVTPSELQGMIEFWPTEEALHSIALSPEDFNIEIDLED